MPDAGRGPRGHAARATAAASTRSTSRRPGPADGEDDILVPHRLRRPGHRRGQRRHRRRGRRSPGGCTAATCTCGRTTGIFGVFDPDDGWCRAVDGAEPGGVKGVVCDVIPDGMDLVGWLGVGFIVILLTGFYLWYWPGVKRWANALRDPARPRPVHVQHVAAQGDRLRRLGAAARSIAFTGIAFAFPNLNSWYENVTPAQRDFYLWTPPTTRSTRPRRPHGREPIGVDERSRRSIAERSPTATDQLHRHPPRQDRASTRPGSTRGFDPWTREGGAGNVYVFVDQYSGEIVYDGTPERRQRLRPALGRLELPVAHRRLRRHRSPASSGSPSGSRRSCSASPA